MGVLDNEGLAHFWGKVKDALSGKQDTITAGDGVSQTGSTISVTTPVCGVVTQAEFDALPQKQRNKGLYVISDGGEGGGGSGSAEEIYSTEETRIGTWIDGKPLYAKTYVLNVRCPGAAETAIVDHDLPPIQTLVKSKGIAVFGTIQSPYPSNRVATYYFPDSNAIFASNSNSAGNAATIRSCTIEYTKTTDEGGAS